MAKKKQSFYDRPLHERLAQKIAEGLVSAGAVYLLSPYLMSVLAPIQANINAQAAAGGATVSNVGSAKVANTLIAAAAS